MRQPGIAEQALPKSDLKRVDRGGLGHPGDRFFGEAVPVLRLLERSRWRRRNLQAAQYQQENRDSTTSIAGGHLSIPRNTSRPARSQIGEGCRCPAMSGHRGPARQWRLFLSAVRGATASIGFLPSLE